MEGHEILIRVAKYKKNYYGIKLDSYTGIISERALDIIQDALKIAASKSEDYYQIARFVRLCDNIEEQRSQSFEYAEKGKWGEEIK